MGSSHGFGSTPRDYNRPIQTRVRYGSGFNCLNQPRRVTRRVILQKARRHTAPKRVLRLHVSRRFQGLFHSPRRGTFHRSLTVLCAIGRRVYLALGGGPPSFRPGSSCPAVLTHSRTLPSPALPGYHGLWRRVPHVFETGRKESVCAGPPSTSVACNPDTATRWCLTRCRFRQIPVRSPLLRE
jgi:hypothetical protein